MKKNKATNQHMTVAAAVIIVAALAIGAYVLKTQGNASASSADANPSQSSIIMGSGPKLVGDAYQIPLSDVGSQLKKYTLGIDGKNVRFFVVLGSDGKPRMAIDGCESCGTSKGYSQERADVVCNICGKHFTIDDLGKANLFGKTCEPINLPFSVEAGNILIKKTDMEAEKDRF